MTPTRSVQCLFVLFYLLIPFTLPATTWQAKIDPALLASLEAGQEQALLVTFVEQADVSGAYQIRGKAAKGTYVYSQVQAVAKRSQAAVKRILEANGRLYQSFSVANALYTRVDLATARAIALRPEVAHLLRNPWAPFDGPVRDPSLVESREVSWGLNYIEAPAAWEQGFRGAGVVIAGQDTGYEWDNARLKPQYRGWNGSTANHDYHWHDAILAINLLNNDSLIAPENNPCGLGVDVPCDDHNHGTYTMGIMVGVEDGEDQIGVAPEAQWIGCRNMERGWGSPASYLDCFNWFLAPARVDGTAPDPALAPHVINNSWGCPPEEGCDSLQILLLQQAVETVRAAGIFVVSSAGNEGPDCNTIKNPTATFDASFTIGAIASNDSIARFSSRGVVASDGSGRLKPNIVAPGVNVRSIIRDGHYRSWGGTSAAAPHVAGVVALMISANPQLAGEVDLIEHILETTAIPRTGSQDCAPYTGTDLPNPVFGYGSLNVRAAVAHALEVEIVGTSSPKPEAVVLYPNPATDLLQVRWQTSDQQLRLTLRDGLGRRVLDRQLTSKPAQVDITNLPSGIYYYNYYGKDARGSGKVIIR